LGARDRGRRGRPRRQSLRRARRRARPGDHRHPACPRGRRAGDCRSGRWTSRKGARSSDQQRREIASVSQGLQAFPRPGGRGRLHRHPRLSRADRRHLEPAPGAAHAPTGPAEGRHHGGLRSPLPPLHRTAPQGWPGQRSLPPAHRGRTRTTWPYRARATALPRSSGAGAGGPPDATRRRTPRRARAPHGQAASGPRAARPGGAAGVKKS
jgi:hypothetical protein